MGEYSTAIELVSAYGRGERDFRYGQIEQADFRGLDLRGASFSAMSLRVAKFDRAMLGGTTFEDSDLRGASFTNAHLDRAVLQTNYLRGARLTGAFLLGTVFDGVDLTGADLAATYLVRAHFVRTGLEGAMFNRAVLGTTTFSDVDVSRLCDVDKVQHTRPSFVDLRSVLRSYRHPGLKRFLVDCGVPPFVAEYTIAAAEAEGEDALASLMRSTFISYGGPDEAFARRLYEALRAHGVVTYFFAETSRVGGRLSNEMHDRIQEHDRVILVCSRNSLDRPGVRNEIQETFDREARDGGATYLLPIMLDDYVLSSWADPLAERVRGRVVGDFRGAMSDGGAFDKAMRRLLAALRKDPG